MRWVAILAVALMLGACASVTRGFNDQVQFLSDPPGAEVRTSMGHLCMTPCTLQFGRRDEFTVMFSKPGYMPQQVAVQTRIAPGGAAGFVGNALIGGVVGAGVDVASGATLDHCPNPVTVTLRPLARGQSAANPPPPYAPPQCTSGAIAAAVN